MSSPDDSHRADAPAQTPGSRAGGSGVAPSIAAEAAAAAVIPFATARPGHKRPLKRSRAAAATAAAALAAAAAASNGAVATALSTESPPIHAVAAGPTADPTADPTTARAGGAHRGAPDAHVTESADPTRRHAEACAHPTILGNLCAVCGAPMAPPPTVALTGGGPDGRSAAGVVPHGAAATAMSRMTVAGGLTVSVSEQESQRLARQDADRLRRQGRLSLVLDLDHTLVHATSDGRAREHLDREDVRSIWLPLAEGTTVPPYGQPTAQSQPMVQHFLKFRPHLKAFFERLHPLYEFGVYTAGTREYALEVCLVIARLLVGAARDLVHLHDLRRRVALVRYELQFQRSQGQTDGDEDAPPATENTNKKKRKVTFGEPTADMKSDHSTQSQLEQLEAELNEAERLENMAQNLRQKLFGSRIVSRTDVGDLGRDVKCLKRIFPCGGAMAVVVDDREDVWARAQGVIFADRPGEPPDNLLLVRPYHWDTFLGFADINNAAGVDLSNFGSDQVDRRSERDLQLLWTCNILVRLHEAFYGQLSEGREANVPELLAAMRRQILPSAKIVLSGLVPLHHQQRLRETTGPRPPVVRYVESLGAEYQPDLTESTTHVVAAKDGTDKINSARKIPGCFVVKPSWLMECLWSVSRRNEQSHLLGSPPVPVTKNQTSNGIQATKASSKGNDSSSSDDDDDLAAELENELVVDD